MIAIWSAILTQSQSLRLEWDYPESAVNSNVYFKVYSTTNIRTRPVNWPVITNVPGTSRWYNIKKNPGARFYTVTTVSNGIESDFIAWTNWSPKYSTNKARITIQREKAVAALKKRGLVKVKPPPLPVDITKPKK